LPRVAGDRRFVQDSRVYGDSSRDSGGEMVSVSAFGTAYVCLDSFPEPTQGVVGFR
jgi:hypothetical protein